MATTMRKRDKKKEKAKAELVARKRKELYEDVAPQGRRTTRTAEEGGKKKLGHRQRVGRTGISDGSKANILGLES